MELSACGGGGATRGGEEPAGGEDQGRQDGTIRPDQGTGGMV